MFRYLYNVVVIYPLIIVLKFFTGTYTVNLFIAGGGVFFLELVVTLAYFKYLCIKRPLENIEDVPGYKLKAIKSDMMVLHIRTKDAAEYITKEVGNKTAMNLIENQK